MRALPAERAHLAAASARLGREYHEEPLGSWAHACVRAELRGARTYLTAQQKSEVLERQDHKCAICDEGFADETPEFDHTTPHALGGKDFQALCRTCHLTTSAEEFNLTRAGTTLTSHLCESAWQALVAD